MFILRILRRLLGDPDQYLGNPDGWWSILLGNSDTWW